MILPVTSPTRFPVNVVAVIAPPTVTLSRVGCPATSREPLRSVRPDH